MSDESCQTSPWHMASDTNSECEVTGKRRSGKCRSRPDKYVQRSERRWPLPLILVSFVVSLAGLFTISGHAHIFCSIYLCNYKRITSVVQICGRDQYQRSRMLGESMTRHSRHDDHHNTEVKRGGCLDQIDNPSPGKYQRQTLPSLNRLIHDLRINRTRNPELDQRAVEILPPFLVNCLNRVHRGNGIGLHGYRRRFLGSIVWSTTGDPS